MAKKVYKMKTKTRTEVLKFLRKHPMKSEQDLTFLRMFILIEFPNETNYSDFHKVAPDDPSSVSFSTFEYWFNGFTIKKAVFKNKTFIYTPRPIIDDELSFRFAIDLTTDEFLITDITGSGVLSDGENKVISITEIDIINCEKILEKLKNMKEE